MNRQSLTGKDGEVRELTSEDYRHMRPASDVLPQALLSVLPKRGYPTKALSKISTRIRLNPEIIDFFKSQGKGWQTKINDVLQEYVDSKCI